MLKKLLAVLVVLAVLFSFAGCTDNVKENTDSSSSKDDTPVSKDIDKADILGLWEGEGKMSEVMTAMEQSGETSELGETMSNMIEVLSKVKSDTEFDVLLKFNEDNTYDVMYETKSYLEAIKEFYKDLFDLLKTDKELFKKFFGFDDAQIDQAIAGYNLTSFEELVDLLEETTLNANESDFLDSLKSSLTDAVIEGDYIIEKGYTYKIDGEYLKIQATKDSDETNDMILKNGKLAFTKFTGVAKNPNAAVFKNGFEKVDND